MMLQEINDFIDKEKRRFADHIGENEENVVIKPFNRYFESFDGKKVCHYYSPMVSLYILNYEKIIYGTAKIQHASGIITFGLFRKGDMSRAAIRKYHKGKEDIVKPIIEKETFNTFWNNSYNFLKIKNKDIKLRRGILLSGPPGNGKTSLIKYLRDSTNAACYVYSLKELLNWNANPFSYSQNRVIIIDDIDVDVFDRKKSGERSCTLLSMMDGVNKNSNPCVTIFSTNEKVENIDPAFLRPGRIDVRLEIGLPTDDLRKEYLDTWETDIFDCVSKETILNKTKGWSFAEIEEIKQRVKMSLLFNEKPIIDFNKLKPPTEKRRMGL